QTCALPILCLWIATRGTRAHPRNATERSRLWWEQRLSEHGFAPCGVPLTGSAPALRGRTGCIALVMERPVSAPVAKRTKSHAQPVETATQLIQERDATIRALQRENRRLTELIASKDASF